MLQLGKSKPWKEVMEIMTGTPKMDTGAYREYFAPLEKWLIKQNKEENNLVPIGLRICSSIFLNVLVIIMKLIVIKIKQC